MVFRPVKSGFDVVLTHNMISHQLPQEHSYCVQVLVSHHKRQQYKIKLYLRLRLISLLAIVLNENKGSIEHTHAAAMLTP